nr:DUF4304 domain-containing protein [Lysobacter sp. MMG2]
MFTTDMNLDTRFDQIIKAGITPVLAVHGFKKRRYVYERKEGCISYIVDLQRSQWSNASALDFTMNCGVHIPGVISMFANRPDPKNPKIVDCCVGSRLGMLSPDHKDKWWSVTAEDSGHAPDDRLSEDLRAAIEGLALPFLRLFPSQLAVAEFLSDVPREYRQVFPMHEAQRLAYAAIIFRMVGDSKAGSALESAVALAAGSPLESTLATLEESMRSGRSGG